MSNTFVKLPSGNIEIGHIRETYEDLKGSTFQYLKWTARQALIERKGGTSWLYTGQTYDSNYIDLVENGWTHDHCEICFMSFGDNENDYIFSSGYFNGYDWVCKSCYETIISVNNLEETLRELPKYQA